MKLVNISSISFLLDSLRENEILDMVAESIRNNTDIVLLPETCTGAGSDKLHSMNDTFMSRIKQLAKKHTVYILCPVYLKCDGNARYNSAVLFDRRGEVAMLYNKTYPYWMEYGLNPPTNPGNGAYVASTDFGTVSTLTCFDVNFPSLWEGIAAQGAEIVFWTSAYSGGLQLSAHALNYHYMIVTATGYADCAVFDMDGREIYYKYENGRPVISYIALDLDRVVCHSDFNEDKIEKLQKEHPEVDIQHHYKREHWYVLNSKDPVCNVRELCGEYKIENLRDYKMRSKIYADNARPKT